MNRIEWTDNLSVGIKLIDSQHKNWIECYNKTAEVINGEYSPEEIARTLGFLVDYTEVHFSTEERAMEESNYPDLEQHEAEHDTIRKAVSKIANDFMADCMTNKLGAAVEKLLGTWLIQHIQSVDMRFAAFAKKTGREIVQRSELT